MVIFRLPQSDAVHRETYEDAYDARSHDLEQDQAVSQVSYGPLWRVGKCTWSENVARQLSLSERPNLKNFLRSKGIELK